MIDLDNSEIVKALQYANPAHYAKIQKIIFAHSIRSQTIVSNWMRTSLNAKEIDYSGIVLTSLPAKKQLSFKLDNSHYTITVTLN